MIPERATDVDVGTSGRDAASPRGAASACVELYKFNGAVRVEGLPFHMT